MNIWALAACLISIEARHPDGGVAKLKNCGGLSHLHTHKDDGRKIPAWNRCPKWSRAAAKARPLIHNVVIAPIFASDEAYQNMTSARRRKVQSQSRSDRRHLWDLWRGSCRRQNKYTRSWPQSIFFLDDWFPVASNWARGMARNPRSPISAPLTEWEAKLDTIIYLAGRDRAAFYRVWAAGCA